MWDIYIYIIFFKCVKWVLNEVLCVLGTQCDCLPGGLISHRVSTLLIHVFHCKV